jgi:hypothetical protein
MLDRNNEIAQTKHALIGIPSDMIDEVGNWFVSSIIIPPPLGNRNGAKTCHGNNVFDPGRAIHMQIMMIPGIRDTPGSPPMNKRIIVIIIGIEDSNIAFGVNAEDNDITIVGGLEIDPDTVSRVIH